MMLAPWNHETTGEKQKTRELFADCVERYIGTPHTLLLLPGENGYDARYYRARWENVKIHGIERDAALAKQIDRNGELNYITVFEGSVGSFVLKDHPFTYDAAHLDYVGPATYERLIEIRNFVHAYTARKNQPKKMLLGVTVQKSPRTMIEPIAHLVRANCRLTKQQWMSTFMGSVEFVNFSTPEPESNSIWNTPDTIGELICRSISGVLVDPENPDSDKRASKPIPRWTSRKTYKKGEKASVGTDVYEAMTVTANHPPATSYSKWRLLNERKPVARSVSRVSRVKAIEYKTTEKGTPMFFFVIEVAFHN